MTMVYPVTFHKTHAEWRTASNPVTDAQHTGGYNTYTIRNIMQAAESSVNGSKIRITFRSGPTSGGFQTSAVYVGHAAASGDSYDFDGGQQELLFSASSGFSITTTDTTLLSDELTFSFDASKDLIIAFHMDTGTYDDPAVDTVKTNWTCWYKVANEPGVTDVTGYTEQAAGFDCVGIDLVEIFG